MVRLINNKNVDFLASVVYRLMRFQEYFTRIANVNYQAKEPCIYAMWHAHQFCLHGIPKRSKLNILISNSKDGDIIARAVEKWGFKVVRGSTGRKGSIEGAMQLIERLKAGESAAIMVDGPRGPAKKVKGGIVKLAKMAGVPIVPVYWYSPQKNFLTLPSWDKMKTPFLLTKIINIYGNPINVTSTNDNDEELYFKMIQNSLEDLERRIPDIYKEVKNQLRWTRNKG